MNRPELVIFDLAGTTVEDRGQVPQAFEATLAAHGIAVTARQIQAVRGASKRQAILGFIPEGSQRMAMADTVYRAFRTRLAERYASEGVREIPGAMAAFGALRSQGIKVALNTGFDREITGLLLDSLGWSQGVVDAVVCGDDVSQGRPAPYLIFHAMEATRTYSVHQVANVGDTELDLRAGHHAGVCWNLGVLSGAHDRATLEKAPHTQLLASVAELAAMW